MREEIKKIFSTRKEAPKRYCACPGLGGKLNPEDEEKVSKLDLKWLKPSYYALQPPKRCI